MAYTYYNNGNIHTISKVGTYSYDSGRPHAVTAIDNAVGRAIPPTQCDVTYNLRKHPSSISGNSYSITLDHIYAEGREVTPHGQGLKEGGIAAGIGLGSGALFGGLTQGYIDHKQGYSFWDGTKTIGTETVSIASNAEPITQLGDDDCLTAAIEWTDHTLGGNMTYGEANGFIDYGKNGASDLNSVYNYCSNKGYPLSYISEDASAADKYYAVYSKIKNGGRVIINENLGHVSGVSTSWIPFGEAIITSLKEWFEKPIISC